eukprot:2804389-Amphidinium_carterae.1
MMQAEFALQAFEQTMELIEIGADPHEIAIHGGKAVDCLRRARQLLIGPSQCQVASQALEVSQIKLPQCFEWLC